MKSSDFLIDNLKVFVKRDRLIRFKYSYDNFSDDHYIMVQPSTKYEDDKFYNFEINLQKQFIEKFPYENLTFFAKEDLIELQSPIEIEDEKYKNL